MLEMEAIRGHLHEVFLSTNVDDWLILLRAGSSYFHVLGISTSPSVSCNEDSEGKFWTWRLTDLEQCM